MNKKGSATVEATIAMPIFIFAMLALYHMNMCRIAELQVYEMVTECSEYVAEQGYIKEECLVTPTVIKKKYLDNDELVSRYIKGGQNGVVFVGSYIDKEHMLHLKVKYFIVINVPLIKNFYKVKSYEIKQRCYVGYDEIYSCENNTDEQYVYITDNMDVYHVSRNCTHLRLSKKIVSFSKAKKDHYMPCDFCVKNGKIRNYVIVTEQGTKYHIDSNCSGLKRTVKRVRLSSVSGLGGCSRCAK